MIITSNLSKAYNNNVVLNIENLEIPKGQSFGLVGNNGAGKTTVFNIISGFLKQDSGTIVFDGQDLTLLPDWKRARAGISE